MAANKDFSVPPSNRLFPAVFFHGPLHRKIQQQNAAHERDRPRKQPMGPSESTAVFLLFVVFFVAVDLMGPSVRSRSASISIHFIINGISQLSCSMDSSVEDTNNIEKMREKTEESMVRRKGKDGDTTKKRREKRGPCVTIVFLCNRP